MCISRSHFEAHQSLSCRVPSSPALTRGPLSPGFPGRPASPCGERGGEWGEVGTGAVGGGAVVLGTPTYRGAFVTFLSSFSLRYKSVGRSQERKLQVTSIPLLPASPPSPQGHNAPIAPVPHYLLASHPDLPRSACSARLPLFPWLSWVTLSKRRGNSQGRVWASGERRGTACRNKPSRAGQTDRWTDEWKGSGDNTFGPLLPVRPTIP